MWLAGYWRAGCLKASFAWLVLEAWSGLHRVLDKLISLEHEEMRWQAELMLLRRRRRKTTKDGKKDYRDVLDLISC